MLIASGCSKKIEPVNTENLYTPVEVKNPIEGNLSKTLTFTGIVSSKESVTVTPTIMGAEENVKILVKIGDYVEKNQVLAVLDNNNTAEIIESSRLQYELAKSSYDSQYETYTISKDNFKNIEELYNAGAVSESDYKNAKLRASDNQLKLLENQLNQAKFAYKNSLENLDDLNLIAPVNGIVTNINIFENNLVSSQNSISILNMENLEINFYIPESKIDIVKPGMNVNIEIPSINAFVDSTVNWINPQKNLKKNMYEGNLELNNNDKLIYPGMKSFVNIELSNSKTFLIPIDAVLFDKTHFVYVAESNKSIKKVIEVGDDNGEMIEIISGINKEDEIIIKGQTFIKDNSTIKIVRRQ
jgi:RND family efflux transporter MFP subunit